MANGRFLDKRVTNDERLATISLKANFLYLALTPHCDVDGKLSGNVTLVKAVACPLRKDLSEKTIGKCLQELHDVGLIEWYTAGKKVIRVCDFSKYQQGLRRDRENPSELPDPESGVDAGVIPQACGSDPALMRDGSGVSKSPSISLSTSEAEVEVKEQVEGKEKVEVEGEVEVEVKDAGGIECDDPTIGELVPGGTAPRVDTFSDDFEKLFSNSGDDTQYRIDNNLQ